MPQAPNTPINWHLTSVSQRLIARLHPGNVERRWHVAVPADFWTYASTDRVSNETLTALEQIRDVSIDEAVGFSFEEANTDAGNDRRRAYLDAMDWAPTVTQVLADAFAADQRAAA